MQIINSPNGDNVKVTALDSLASISKVTDVSINECKFFNNIYNTSTNETKLNETEE